MSMSTSYDPSPTPPRAFAAMKTPLPGSIKADDGSAANAGDQLDRMLAEAKAGTAELRELNRMADAILRDLGA